MVIEDRLPHAGVCPECNGYGMLFKCAINGVTVWMCHRCMADIESRMERMGAKREKR